MNIKLTDPQVLEEETHDLKLRPEDFDGFIGQTKLKDNLKIFIEAARSRKETLDHVLLYGPPGLGKTTLAQIIAKEMNVSFRSTSGPIITKSGDLASILTNLEEGDVLFIDEIHRLSSVIEEVLYPAMEDFKLDLIIGEGPAARSIKIDLPRFTLVAATTRLGLLTNPLRDRFGIPLRLSFYSTSELQSVLKQASKKLKVFIEEDGAEEIARRGRGTPRIALRLLKRVSDFAFVKGEETITKEIADEALNKLDVDKMGLDSNDLRYLRFLAQLGGGPVGIDTIAAGLSEDRDSLEETIEPYLLQIGFIQRTPRGRILTTHSVQHLNTSLELKR